MKYTEPDLAPMTIDERRAWFDAQLANQQKFQEESSKAGADISVGSKLQLPPTKDFYDRAMKRSAEIKREARAMQ